MLTNLITLGVCTISMLTILFKSKHLGMIFRLSLISIVSILSSIVIYASQTHWVKYIFIVLVLVFIPLTWYITRNKEIVFDDFRIVNFAFFKNLLENKKTEANGYRIIGEVVPQHKGELKHNGALVEQNQKTAVRQTVLSGKNGSGKSYFIRSLCRQDIAAGRNLIYADYKGDIENANKLLDYAAKHGYELYVVHNGKANFNYDPMRNINNAARIEAFMNSNEWSEPYYKRQTQLFLNKTIPLYSRIFDKQHKAQGVNFTAGFQEFLKTYKYDNQERDGMNGVKDILSLMLESSTGRIYGNRYSKTLDFKRMIETNEKYMLAILFDSNLKDTATSFSAVVFSDLLYNYNAAGQEGATSLYGDESSALKNIAIVDDLLSRGRSAGISVLIAFQTLSQVSYSAGADYLNVLVENINSRILFPGVGKEIAEKISGLGYSDETFGMMTLKNYDEKGIAPTMFYDSDFTGLKGDKKKRHILKPYIFDAKSENEEPENQLYLLLNEADSGQVQTRENQYEKYGRDVSSDARIGNGQTQQVNHNANAYINNRSQMSQEDIEVQRKLQAIQNELNEEDALIRYNRQKRQEHQQTQETQQVQNNYNQHTENSQNVKFTPDGQPYVDNLEEVKEETSWEDFL